MIYDVVVIGGGPAGMMAAGRAGERGARVLLLEKNERLGIKLLATGHTRCNITNELADGKRTIGVYGPNSKFLYSAFSQFGVGDTLNFFTSLGVTMKIEDKGRVFPESNKASEVQKALMQYLENSDVQIVFRAVVRDIIVKDNLIEKVILTNGQEIFGKNFIIATGGKSYPQTGSSGDGFTWLNSLGHTINNLRPALTPITVKEKIVKDLEGLSLKNVRLSVFQSQKKIVSDLGEIMFTTDGVSGPLVIDLSSQIGTIMREKVLLQIDFQPEIGKEEFEKKTQDEFHSSHNKIFKNYLSGIVPPKLVRVILKLTGIDGRKQVSTITKDERRAFVDALKEFTLEVKSLKGYDKAMITAGGVNTKEVDPRTMRSRLISNLYLAGEILDLDGPTGGYNLQICWSTGYVAGENVSIN